VRGQKKKKTKTKETQYPRCGNDDKISNKEIRFKKKREQGSILASFAPTYRVRIRPHSFNNNNNNNKKVSFLTDRFFFCFFFCYHYFYEYNLRFIFNRPPPFNSLSLFPSLSLSLVPPFTFVHDRVLLLFCFLCFVFFSSRLVSILVAHATVGHRWWV